jgi:hypothetical protein
VDGQINIIDSIQVLKLPPRNTVSQGNITTSHQIVKEALLSLKLKTKINEFGSIFTKKTESKTPSSTSKLFSFKKKRKARKCVVMKPKNPNIIRLFE